MDVYIFVNIFILALAALMPKIIAFVSSQSFKNKISVMGVDLAIINKRDYTNNILFFTFCFLLLMFITVFRSPDNGLSIDYHTYVSTSKYIHANGLGSISENSLIQIEPGLAIMLYISGWILSNTIIPFIVLTTAVTLSAYFYRFHKDSQIVWVSIFCLITVGSYYVLFNGIAQATAVAVTFLAAGYIYNKPRSIQNFLKYSAIIILAALIHKTALLMLPMYFLLRYKFEKSRLNIILITLLMFLIALFLLKTEMFVNFGIRYFFPEYIPHLSAEIPWLTGGSLIAVIRPFLLVLFIYVNKRYINYKNLMDVVSINSTVIFMIINMLSLRVQVLQRFSYYFIPISLLIIPLILSRMNKVERNKWIIIVVTFCMIFSIASLYLSGDLTFSYIWD